MKTLIISNSAREQSTRFLDIRTIHSLISLGKNEAYRTIVFAKDWSHGDSVTAHDLMAALNTLEKHKVPTCEHIYL